MESAESTDSDSDWLADLELAVASGCDFNTVRLLAENRCLTDHLRGQTWQILLGVLHKPNPFIGQEELFNLPEQLEIRTACSKICENLGNSEADRVSVISDLESVITLFCKTCNVQFSPNNGWTDILQLLVALRLPRAQLYHLFYAFTTKYIPRNYSNGEKVFNLFRLLLLYHEPELCAFLDSRRLSPSSYCVSWFNSLFTSCCELKVALKLWDIYLQHADPFEVFFMALVILVNWKPQILAMKDASAEEIAAKLNTIPSSLMENDIDDFFYLVRFYMDRTPQSYRRDYHGPLFGTNFTEMADTEILPVLCLPVSAQELMPVIMGVKNPNISYVVVDTRPRDQFVTGHINGSFLLDASQLLVNPDNFNRIIEELEAKCKAMYATDFHWCVLSSGFENDDSLCNMCIAFLLKQKKCYISSVSGGYKAVHRLLKGDLIQKLKSHDSNNCLVCLEGGQHEIQTSELNELHVVSPFDFLDSATSTVFTTSANVLKKLKKALHNPVLDRKRRPRHVSPSARHGKGYRGQVSVFSIADDGNDVSDEECSVDELNEPSASSEKISVSDWLMTNDIIASFDCKHLEKGGRFVKSLLALKDDCLYVVHLTDVEDEGTIQAMHPLSTVGKITSRRMFPELLSFTFYPKSNSSKELPAKVEKFVVEKAGDCARIIKQAILVPKQ